MIDNKYKATYQGNTQAQQKIGKIKKLYTLVLVEGEASYCSSHLIFSYSVLSIIVFKV
jgi:hypothetical protein